MDEPPLNAGSRRLSSAASAHVRQGRLASRRVALARVAWFGRLWPVYFSEPESDLARPHVERIRRECRMNMETRHYDDDEIDLRPMLARVRCPTLVVCGEHDFICGPAWNRPIAAGIAGAEFRVIESAGHCPQYEAPAEFRSALFAWIEHTG
jgi:pimeloyl-ACP methyl ester carboxylesterase